MVGFSDKHGTQADEIVSSPTPPNVDRNTYYENEMSPITAQPNYRVNQAESPNFTSDSASNEHD